MSTCLNMPPRPHAASNLHYLVPIQIGDVPGLCVSQASWPRESQPARSPVLCHASHADQHGDPENISGWYCKYCTVTLRGRGWQVAEGGPGPVQIGSACHKADGGRRHRGLSQLDGTLHLSMAAQIPKPLQLQRGILPLLVVVPRFHFCTWTPRLFPLLPISLLSLPVLNPRAACPFLPHQISAMIGPC